MHRIQSLWNCVTWNVLKTEKYHRLQIWTASFIFFKKMNSLLIVVVDVGVFFLHFFGCLYEKSIFIFTKYFHFILLLYVSFLVWIVAWTKAVCCFHYNIINLFPRLLFQKNGKIARCMHGKVVSDVIKYSVHDNDKVTCNLDEKIDRMKRTWEESVTFTKWCKENSLYGKCVNGKGQSKKA